jgi:putative tricarboxylic transport membrane protein
MTNYLIEGLIQLLDIKLILLLNLGMLIGIVFGAIPGLTGNLGIVIFLPFTFTMEPATAIIFLMAIFCGGEFGGSISAILIGTPGTNAAAATLLDGYPLALKGHARKALLIALISSTFGGLVSSLLLLFAAPGIARFTINFGPPEYFAIAVFGLSIIAGISGDNMFKGLISGTVGVLISMVGMDAITGAVRLTFGNLNLMRGLSLLPVLIGVFAVPSILEKVKECFSTDKTFEVVKLNKSDTVSRAEIKRIFPTMVKSSFIGSLIGAIPGPGTGIASFMSYDEARRSSKNSKEFGHGALEGIAAAETANNAVTAASLIPLLTLGIPGSPAAAALIGAFMIHGMVPGPTLFREQGVIVYTIMLGILVANIFMFIQGSLLSRFFAKVTKISNVVMVPILVLMCTSGAFTVNNSIFEMGVFLVFGILSFFMVKLYFPPVPIVLGFVLGPLFEFNLRRSLAMSEGSWMIFVTRPISLVLLIITVFMLVFTLRRKRAK